jgi:hypothetical protein
VVVEHYPIIPFDAHGRIDLRAHQHQLQADVDRLEANDYQPAPTEWHPEPMTRRRLIAATRHPGRLIPSPSPPGRLSAA